MYLGLTLELDRLLAQLAVTWLVLTWFGLLVVAYRSGSLLTFSGAHAQAPGAS